MTMSDQLVEDLKTTLEDSPPVGLPEIEVRAMLDARKRPIPCIVIQVDPDPTLIEPLNTSYNMTGKIDLLTHVNADDDADDATPIEDARAQSKLLFDWLNTLDSTAVGQSFLHLMEARPSESVGDDDHALHSVPFEAVVQPCVAAE